MPASSPPTTLTGHFSLGFRRGGGDWQKDLPALLDWARSNHFAMLDLGGGPDVAGEAAQVAAAGLTVGSVDLCDGRGWSALLSADPATLPSLDELRAKLVGLIQAPATKLAQLQTAPAAKLARVFAAYADRDAA